jgi:alpha-amylase
MSQGLLEAQSKDKMAKAPLDKLMLLGMASMAILSSCQPTSESYQESEEVISNANGGVYYEIFVRAFADSDGDKIGDFNGITSKLGYLQDLGVSDLWLMPIHPSPSYHGYDVTDYYDVHSEYGTMDDFENLVAKAKEYNINIIIDYVLNHASSQHPYFIASARQITQGLTEGEVDYREYFNWKYNEQPRGYEPYGSTSWYYEANFWGGMPDWNLDNQNVVDYLFAGAKFWLDKGVNGFRLDAVKYCFQNTVKDVAFLSDFNDFVKAETPQAFIIGEDWDTEAHMLNYYESGIDAFFAFESSTNTGKVAFNVNNAYGQNLATYITGLYHKIKARNEGGYVSLFLSNHDQNRIGGMYPVNSAKGFNVAKAMASAYLLSPGHPFIYYGEEINLRGSGSDPNKRLPMLWGNEYRDDETYPNQEATYPVAHQVRVGAFDALKDPWSLTSHYRNVLRVRNKYQIFTEGIPAVFALEETKLMGLTFTHADSQRFPKPLHVIHNFYDLPLEFETTYTVLEEIRANNTEPLAKNATGLLVIAPYSTLILH